MNNRRRSDVEEQKVKEAGRSVKIVSGDQFVSPPFDSKDSFQNKNVKMAVRATLIASLRNVTNNIPLQLS